jgi:hypothetical protein
VTARAICDICREWLAGVAATTWPCNIARHGCEGVHLFAACADCRAKLSLACEGSEVVAL